MTETDQEYERARKERLEHLQNLAKQKRSGRFKKAPVIQEDTGLIVGARLTKMERQILLVFEELEKNGFVRISRRTLAIAIGYKYIRPNSHRTDWRPLSMTVKGLEEKGYIRIVNKQPQKGYPGHSTPVRFYEILYIPEELRGDAQSEEEKSMIRELRSLRKIIEQDYAQREQKENQ